MQLRTKPLVCAAAVALAAAGCGSGGGETPSQPTVQSACPGLATPLVVVDTTTLPGAYHLAVTNAVAYPDRLFEQSPDLPPCGLNPRASRTWIDILDARGPRLYGYCAIMAASELQTQIFLPFVLASDATAIVLELHDRRCDARATSSPVPLPGR
jgi:hypothetical protein